MIRYRRSCSAPARCCRTSTCCENLHRLAALQFAMALLDIRQRTGWLFGAIVVSHIILISAQVTTKRGVPILQEVTFRRLPRCRRRDDGIGSAREGWQNYFALQQIRRENEQLKAEVTKLRVSLEQERSTAQQTRTLQQLLDLRSATPSKRRRRRSSAAARIPSFEYHHHRQRHAGRSACRHGRDVSGRHCR